LPNLFKYFPILFNTLSCLNPDKFQAIAIGKNAQSKNISFNLNGNIIKTEDETPWSNN
jgi:hypothetical protein